MKLNSGDFIQKKKEGKKIVMLTAYDAITAQIMEAAGADVILVGDSLAMTALGYDSTKDVTLGEMLHHVMAVCRGAKNTHVIGDMPIGTYDNPKQAVINAKRFLKVGCDSIKFEGCHADIARAFRENGIPAVGHIGLTPQTADSFKVRGRDKREAARLKKESRILSRQGVILLILECIPWLLGKEISRLIKIPTIGIGAGSYCDGQVLVAADMLGLFTRFKPRFVRRYANLFEEAVKAVERFGKDVKAGRYPSKKESY